MTRPSIFLCMPKSFGIHKLIAAHLQAHGFEVRDLSFNNDNNIFRNPGILEKLHIKYRKKILLRHKAKESVIRANNRKQIQKEREQILDAVRTGGGADYALFIRGDIYDEEMLHAIRSRTRIRCVNYQWDGLDRFPGILEKLPFFDAAYAFDPYDIRAYPEHGLRPATNFWFDRLPRLNAPGSDIYYIGSHLPGFPHSETLVRIACHAEKQGLHTDLSIFHFNNEGYGRHRALYPHARIKPIHHRHRRPFQENLARLLNSRVLIDFDNPAHRGLSFRPFEALGYGKKLITTNPETARYDFYHPDNIYIFDGTRLDGLSEFLAAPYRDPDLDLRRKYSFGNWIRYILQIEPHQAITLPPPR